MTTTHPEGAAAPAARDVALELAVQDPDGVRVAAAVRAHRVELCVGLGATGGLTPSAG
ncbi:copper homeostasis protein CutC, partial [Cellulosimicrobium funkei]